MDAFLLSLNMTTEIPKQLCLIKDIFSYGEQHAFFGSKLDKRLAIIHYHNSIELFLRYSLNMKAMSNDDLEGMRFKNKMEEFEKRLLKGETISNKSKLLDLNDLRNKIYHNYLEPRNEEVNEANFITKLFLEEYIKKIFKLNFNIISSFNIETIRNPFVKEAYVEAIEAFEQTKYKQSMLSFQNAFNEQWGSVYGTPVWISPHTSTNVPVSENKSFLEDIAHDIHALVNTVNEISEMLKKNIVKENHLIIKKWIDDVYHNYAIEEVTHNDLIKAQRIVEEFISETDDNILDECLQQRKKEYEESKRYNIFDF